MKKIPKLAIMGAPLSWRDGQTLFNFLWWLKEEKGVLGDASNRLADTFHLSNEELNIFYKEFINNIK